MNALPFARLIVPKAFRATSKKTSILGLNRPCHGAICGRNRCAIYRKYCCDAPPGYGTARSRWHSNQQAILREPQPCRANRKLINLLMYHSSFYGEINFSYGGNAFGLWRYDLVMAEMFRVTNACEISRYITSRSRRIVSPYARILFGSRRRTVDQLRFKLTEDLLLGFQLQQSLDGAVDHRVQPLDAG